MDTKQKLNRLILITVLFTLGMVFSDVFVNIFIWRLESSFSLIIIYSLSSFIVIPFAFYLLGHLCRKTDRVNIYKIGILLYALFYLAVIIFNENVVNHLIPIGILRGAAMGFYWFGYHILTYDYTVPANRDRFYSYASIASGVSSMFAPPIAGYIIVTFTNFTGYYTIFAITAVLLTGAMILSTSLHSTPINHPHKIKDLIFSGSRRWRGVMQAYFFLTAKDSIQLFLFAVLIVKVSGSEFTFGKIAMIFASLVILTAFLMGKVSRPENRTGFVFAGCVLQLFGACFLLYEINLITLIIHSIFNPVGDQMMRIPMQAYTLDVMGEDKDIESRKMEYLAAREIPIAIGRIITLLIFMAFIQYLPVSGLKAIILLISLLPFGAWAAMRFNSRNT
ncbi:MAG TPA: MFS transporter [Firmicutes bacterium]|nr:MFS transporter [Bacillota bacterium]